MHFFLNDITIKVKCIGSTIEIELLKMENVEKLHHLTNMIENPTKMIHNMAISQKACPEGLVIKKLKKKIVLWMRGASKAVEIL